MGQVSRRQLPRIVSERMFELLIKAIIEAKDTAGAIALLRDLLTPVERIMIAKRLAIAVLLYREKTYEEIQDTLKVSKPTIAMVNGQLKYFGHGYREFVDKLSREKRWQGFFDKLGDVTFDHVQPKEKGSGIWIKLQQRAKKERNKREAI